MIGTSAVRYFTKKDTVLYSAYANIVFGDIMNQKMTDDYLVYAGHDPKKMDVLVYKNLYVADDPSTENHQYAYASKMKILGAISSHTMDVMYMNNEAFGQMSASGLLMDLDVVKQMDPDLYQDLEPYLVANTVILDDNSIEYNLGEASVYEATTEEVINAIDLSTFPLFEEAGLGDRLLIGVIANSRHIEEDISYIRYLFTAGR